MQVWSNDRYVAPLHRVLASSEADRFSAPFFFNPPYTAAIGPVAGTGVPRYVAVSPSESDSSVYVNIAQHFAHPRKQCEFFGHCNRDMRRMQCAELLSIPPCSCVRVYMMIFTLTYRTRLLMRTAPGIPRLRGRNSDVEGSPATMLMKGGQRCRSPIGRFPHRKTWQQSCNETPAHFTTSSSPSF